MPVPSSFDYGGLYKTPDSSRMDYRNMFAITLKRDAARVAHITALVEDTFIGGNICEFLPVESSNAIRLFRA